jgi:hypothetical protein
VVFATLGQLPRCEEYSTTEQLRSALATYLSNTHSTDARAFVFQGQQRDMLASEDRRQSPVLVLQDGTQLPIFANPLVVSKRDTKRTGCVYEFGDDFVTADRQAGTSDFDDSDDFLM